MRLWLAAALVAGCCPARAPCPAAAPAIDQPPAAAAEAIEPAAPAQTAVTPPAAGNCLGPEPGGFLPKEDEAPEKRCRPNYAGERQVRAALLKAYRKKPGSRVEVSFDCDPIVKRIRFISKESGDPRFYRLHLLWRAGEVFRTLDLRWRRTAKLKNSPAPRRVYVRRGEVPVKTVDALESRLIAYLGARIREVEAEDPGFSSGHAALSSDPVEVIRVQGEDGGHIARRFDGSVTSANQDERRPYDGAFALLDPVMKSASGDSETLEPEEIRALAEWSWAQRYGPDPGYRAAKLAQISNSRQFVPLLMNALYQTGDSTNDDTEALIRALKQLTGLALTTATGSAEATAQAYYDACAPAYGLPEGSTP